MGAGESCARIAYDAKTGLFYLTGKLWKSIFTGRFIETSR
jgi:glutamine cyclotransferase